MEFWSIAAVVKVSGLSRSTIYREIKVGRFPSSYVYRDHPKRRFWMSHEVKAWQQAQIDKDVPELREPLTRDEFDALLID